MTDGGAIEVLVALMSFVVLGSFLLLGVSWVRQVFEGDD